MDFACTSAFTIEKPWILSTQNSCGFRTETEYFPKHRYLIIFYNKDMFFMW